MKKSKMIFLSAALIGVCFAFTTKAHVKKMPGGFVGNSLSCVLETLPQQCRGGHTICTVSGVTYYIDLNCTTPFTQLP